MPNILEIMGYKIYFWSNENNEPIHIHISKGHATLNSTKVWLTKSGGCIVANNSSKIPEKQLRKILDIIEDNYFFIVSQWKEYFDVKNVRFYC